MILVTTAGKVGTEAAQKLAERGVPVRVLARHPQKAAALANTGVQVVGGDLEIAETIDAALAGVVGVVLVSPATPTQERNVIDAAIRRGGIRHVVKVTSEASADSPIARRRGQAAIEDALRVSGLDYTLLRGNAYMQNFLMLAPSIAASDTFASSAGDGRIGMVDTRDVGAVAAEIAAAPEAHAGRTYRLTGPESLSYADAAVVLSKVLGRTITFRPNTFADDKNAMIAAGLPEKVAEDNAKALGLFARGESDYLTEDVPTLLGRPARSFVEFVADHVPAFS
jgi:uncharacterized protein YbjT (DUF2867 family)